MKCSPTAQHCAAGLPTRRAYPAIEPVAAFFARWVRRPTARWLKLRCSRGNLPCRRAAAVCIGLVMLVLAAAALSVACGSALADGPPALANVNRVVFLGDSITYGGQYIDYINAYLVTRYPDRKIEILNLGLPSETTSGLSEPGHAGGKFPRPCVHERLARLLPKAKADLVVACYGMNDGIYYPLGDERLKAFQDGVRLMADAVAAAKARLLILTPPTFDPVPIKGRTLPAGLDAYPNPYEGYDDVLAKYGEWLLAQRAKGWAVADIHGPMARHLADRRKAKPDFILAGDGVHANATGHLLMAEAVLGAWETPADVDAAVIDAAAGKVVEGKVTGLASDAGVLRFSWLTRRPMPADPAWDAESLALERFADRFNRHRLVVRGAPAARYQLCEGEKVLGTVTREQLAAGVNLLQFPDLSTNRGGPELLKLIRKRGRILCDAYLSDIGHQRPGMSKGLPVEAATKQAAELDAQVRQLAAPVTLSLRLAAAAAAGASGDAKP
jgi:lysophospholipase L1-like esterase